MKEMTILLNIYEYETINPYRSRNYKDQPKKIL